MSQAPRPRPPTGCSTPFSPPPASPGLTFTAIDERLGATDGGRGLRDLLGAQATLLLKDPELRKFIVARSLMVSTALVGPVYVGLAQAATGQALDGLG